MENKIIISIKNLHKSFGKNEVLKGINLTVNKGEDLVILGRSGSGKSVTIKCLVGLVESDRGTIKVFGTDITQLRDNALNPIRMRIGFMFQNGALYDSMSVAQNLAFTLKHHTKDLTKEQIEKKNYRSPRKCRFKRGYRQNALRIIRRYAQTNWIGKNFNY
jgi:phospholipid/cholesterol/gamma-HCH transport system ATP-binding protein